MKAFRVLTLRLINHLKHFVDDFIEANYEILHIRDPFRDYLMSIVCVEKIGHSRLLLWSKIIIITLGLGFIGVILFRNWGNALELIRLISLDYFLLATVLLLLVNLLLSYVFFILLKRNGCYAVSAFEAISLSFVGQVAKYLPGKIWGIVYQTLKINIKGGVKYISLSNIELMVFTIVSSFITGIAMLLYQKLFLLSVMLFLAAPFLSAFITLYLSHVIVCLPILKNYFNNVHSFEGNFSSFYWKLLLSSLFFCVLNSSAFMIFIISVFHFSVDYAAHLSALLILTWILSTLFIIVPAGIGIREFSFVLIGASFDSSISIEQLSTIALAVRLWQVFTDLFGFLFVLLVDYIVISLPRKFSGY